MPLQSQADVQSVSAEETLSEFHTIRQTLVVEVVISSSRLPSWTLALPGGQLLSSINTTHWGLKVGPSYHDLNMIGLFRTKPGIAFAATLAERDERAISKSIHIGHTHFTNKEVRQFAAHCLEHASWYHFWFDNCQSFIVTRLARPIMCRMCSSDSPGLSEPHVALGSLDVARSIEMAYIVMSLVNLMSRQFTGTGLRSLVSGLGVFLTIYSSAHRHNEWQEEKLRVPGLYGKLLSDESSSDISDGGSRTTNAGDGERHRDRKDGEDGECVNGQIIQPDFSGSNEAHHQHLDAEISIRHRKVSLPNPNFERRFIRTCLIILPVVLASGAVLLLWLGAQSSSWSPQHSNPTIILALVLIAMMAPKLFEFDLSFPYIHAGRNGRYEVEGPCDDCFTLSHRQLLRSCHCGLYEGGLDLAPIIPSIEKSFKIPQAHGWSRDETGYLCIRILAGALTLYSCFELSIYNQVERQCIVGLILNPFSPVTPWGLKIRKMSIIAYGLTAGLAEAYAERLTADL